MIEIAEHRRLCFSCWLTSSRRRVKYTATGWSGQAFDRSYRSAEDITVRTHAADQPGGLPGVLRIATTKPHLEGGFKLRCFQLLSLPNVATQLWT
jgi:hypothetical protein